VHTLAKFVKETQGEIVYTPIEQAVKS